MTATARRMDAIHYPETDHMGEDALQRFIAELLRPLIATWLATSGRRSFVGADQFLYFVEGDPRQRVAPDVYVMPGVDPGLAPPCWKLWELDAPPSFALDLAYKDLHLALELGDELGVPLQQGASTHNLQRLAKGMGWGPDDSSSVLRVYETMLRRKVKP